MSAAEIFLLVVSVLALLGLLLWSVAQRLDRLHRREIQSRATLEAQLTHRADAAAELAASGLLDPASAVLIADAAWDAGLRSARLLGEEEPAGVGAGAQRGLLESELSRTLRAALGEPEHQETLGRRPRGGQLLAELAHCNYRAQLARRFHSDAVVQIRQIRSTWLVRTFRLAGHAPMPSTFEMDDVVITSPARDPR